MYDWLNIEHKSEGKMWLLGSGATAHYKCEGSGTKGRYSFRFDGGMYQHMELQYHRDGSMELTIAGELEYLELCDLLSFVGQHVRKKYEEGLRSASNIFGERDKKREIAIDRFFKEKFDFDVWEHI